MEIGQIFGSQFTSLMNGIAAVAVGSLLAGDGAILVIDGGVAHGRFIKDNRILPRGWNPSRALPEGVDPAGIAPVGVEGDSDFLPGSDRVRYRIAAPGAALPLRLTVEALYQSIKPSHTGGMEASRSQEEAVFLKLFPRHQAPAVVSRQEVLVGQGAVGQ